MLYLHFRLSLIHIYPDLIVTILLGFIKDELHANMQMCLVNVVDIFFGAVTGMSHVTDHIPCQHYRPFLQFRLIGKSLPQMGIVIIPFLIKTADSNAPASILIPTKRLHISRFHTDHWCSHLPLSLIHILSNERIHHFPARQR